MTSLPAIVVVDSDQKALDKIENELQRRYAEDYRIVSRRSTTAALVALKTMRDAGERVALVLAEQWMEDLPGARFLERARQHHPDAKRALLVRWGAWSDR